LAASVIGFALAATMVACGGGGGSGEPQAPAQKATALYFTDDFAADHDAVWITVTKVTAVTPAGEVELVAFDPPQLINVPMLKRTGALMGTPTIPADATALRVHVGSAARIQQLDGSLRDVTLAAPGGYIEVRIEGWKRDSGVLTLDFDLPRFTLQGNALTPAVRLAGNDDYAGWSDRYAEIKGNVVSISANSIVLNTPRYGQRTITIDTNTVFVSRGNATWRPVAGDTVEVDGAVTGQGAEGLQFTARAIEQKSSSATAGLTKVEGRVTAVNGSLVTADIESSKHAAAVGSLTFDIAAAVFKRGSAALVSPGVKVDAYLQQQGATWVASVVEVEGAAKSDEGSSGSQANAYAEVKGQVVSATGNVVVLTADHVERLPGVTRGAQLQLDIGAAYFKKGSASCLVAGAPVEVKGYVNAAGELVPVQLELEGACASAYPAPGVTAPGTTPPVTGAVFLEAKGTVTAVRAGEFDMSVFKAEYAGVTLRSVTVRHDATTVFKDLAAMQLAVGQFVEVKGTLVSGVITAAKVERD
jgi:RNase P/RNase MRP subunit p29